MVCNLGWPYSKPRQPTKHIMQNCLLITQIKQIDCCLCDFHLMKVWGQIKGHIFSTGQLSVMGLACVFVSDRKQHLPGEGGRR